MKEEQNDTSIVMFFTPDITVCAPICNAYAYILTIFRMKLCLYKHNTSENSKMNLLNLEMNK